MVLILRTTLLHGIEAYTFELKVALDLQSILLFWFSMKIPKTQIAVQMSHPIRST